MIILKKTVAVVFTLSKIGYLYTKQAIIKSLSTDSDLSWAPDGIAELNKIPGLVRGKIKRNTEKFAQKKNSTEITIEITYAAKGCKFHYTLYNETNYLLVGTKCQPA
jgi:hypothetical protein